MADAFKWEYPGGKIVTPATEPHQVTLPVAVRKPLQSSSGRLGKQPNPSNTKPKQEKQAQRAQHPEHHRPHAATRCGVCVLRYTHSVSHNHYLSFQTSPARRQFHAQPQQKRRNPKNPQNLKDQTETLKFNEFAGFLVFLVAARGIDDELERKIVVSTHRVAGVSSRYSHHLVDWGKNKPEQHEAKAREATTAGATPGAPPAPRSHSVRPTLPTLQPLGM